MGIPFIAMTHDPQHAHSSLTESAVAATLAAYNALIRALLSFAIHDDMHWEHTQHAEMSESLLEQIASAHSVIVRRPLLSCRYISRWLKLGVRHVHGGISLGVTDPGNNSHACVLAGALAWLHMHMLTLVGPLAPAPSAGDWPLDDIFFKWPEHIALELASFVWPITTVSEFVRLLACQHAAPRAIVGCEFTAAVRSAYECQHQFTRVAISVDSRSSIMPGVHACMDLREVAGLAAWDDGWFFPPCTHHVRSDKGTLKFKLQDGRAYWTMAFFIFCWCINVKRRTIEQPNTIIPDLYLSPTQSLRPVDVGDCDTKPIQLFQEGHGPVRTVAANTSSAATPRAVSGHKRLHDFEDSDARDRWRSSWLRFPLLAMRVVESHEIALPFELSPASPRDYLSEIAIFAWACFQAGIYVPADYDNSLAQPSSQADRDYQFMRGQGDPYRVRQGVVPKTLQISMHKDTTLDTGTQLSSACDGACCPMPCL